MTPDRFRPCASPAAPIRGTDAGRGGTGDRPSTSPHHSLRRRSRAAARRVSASLAEGETAIVQAVLAGFPRLFPPRARIAELYAGSGSITFALAQRVRVAAWEGDTAAAASLQHAANRAGLAGRVTVARRDLVRQPIPAAELSGFAPSCWTRHSPVASTQMAQIAAAKPACVIYVSCNPAVLARDARMLRDAGYALLIATPVDQFLWSARLESICVFART